MSPVASKVLRYACLAFSALMFIAAGALMVFSEDKSNAIFAILVTVIVSRVLVIDVAGWLQQRETMPTDRHGPLDGE